jgi:predicted nucleic acid-binding protein
LKIYLDTCCLSRPFNDQTQIRIQRETQAIQIILESFVTGEWQWIVSEVLKIEVDNNKDWIQRDRIRSLMNVANQHILIGSIEGVRSKEIEVLGFKPFDAMHLACAESGNADVFLTTDDRLLRKANRLHSKLGVRVQNPYLWLQEVERNEHKKNDR